jgi:hypothetical protein
MVVGDKTFSVVSYVIAGGLYFWIYTVVLHYAVTMVAGQWGAFPSPQLYS